MHGPPFTMSPMLPGPGLRTKTSQVTTTGTGFAGSVTVMPSLKETQHALVILRGASVWKTCSGGTANAVGANPVTTQTMVKQTANCRIVFDMFLTSLVLPDSRFQKASLVSSKLLPRQPLPNLNWRGEDHSTSGALISWFALSLC